MSSLSPDDTLRVPPNRAAQGRSGSLAQELREQPATLDQVRRARMERTLLQAWRTHAATRVALPRARRSTGGDRLGRALWAGSLAASAVAGGLIAFYLLAGDRPRAPASAGVAHFELRIGDAAVQSGAAAEGQLLESGQHGRIDLDLGSARLRMARGTRLRLDRLSVPELALSLLEGRIDIDFHPRHKGEQRMAIESPAARVQVVGTRFSVEVDPLGNTEVAVIEGVVEVVPRSGASTRRVLAGERTYVRVDDGDEYERTVRDAIERDLRALASAEPRPAPRATVAAAKADMDFSVDAETEVAPSSVSSRAIARRLEASRSLLRRGQHPAARLRLRGLTEAPTPILYRVEALTLMAESYTAQGDIPHAAQAYRRAEEIAPTRPAGHNALFALARLLERYAHDEPAAAATYRRYLERAPQGALALQARQALCRLGASADCE
jgi:hypothetical protein